MRSAQQLGFTLAEIEEIIRYILQRHSPCPLVRDIIRRRLDDTRQQLDRLLAMHERMERAIHAWAKLPDSIPTGNDVCALIDALAATEVGKFVRSTPRRLLVTLTQDLPCLPPALPPRRGPADGSSGFSFRPPLFIFPSSIPPPL